MDRLKPVFLELNEEVSYDHIRIVVASCSHGGDLETMTM